MRTQLILTSLSACLIAYTGLSHAQSVPANMLQPGQWDVSVDMQGMPKGGGTKTGKVCFKPESLAAGQENAMIEAAMIVSQPADTDKKSERQCNLSDIQRDSNGSRWKSSCQGPRGSMQGAGSGVFNPDSAQMSQNFEVSTPMGKRNLTQTITAKRIGECA
jgi:hypothetical protein